MNLAAWKYRNILSMDGGPIATLSTKKTSTLSACGKSYVHEAFAWLRPELTDQKSHLNRLYGTPDGTGTGKFQFIASWKAISEALERWAFHSTLHSKDSGSLGFHIDPTTTGMAAFPGINKSQSQRTALNEAIERWAICAWWEGVLPSRMVPFSAEIDSIEIVTPFADKKVMLLHFMDSKYGLHCYGFAADETRTAAGKKALVELNRNRRALKKYFTENDFLLHAPSEKSINEIPLTIEKRLVYFSTQDGFTDFKTRLVESSSSKISQKTKTPSLIVDREARGPWSNYATVWRCLFEMKTARHLEDSSDYFLF